MISENLTFKGFDSDLGGHVTWHYLLHKEFCLGSGNVSQGAQEIFQELPHEYVPPNMLAQVILTSNDILHWLNAYK